MEEVDRGRWKKFTAVTGRSGPRYAIFLEYSWKDVVVDSKGNTMVALCMCAPELNYLLKNLEKKEYKFKLTAHQEKPLLTVFKEKINKWLLGE